MRKLFFKSMLLLCALIVGSGSVWATDIALTTTAVTIDNFSPVGSSYVTPAADKTIGGYTWNVYQCMNLGKYSGVTYNNLQMKKTDGYITSPTITSSNGFTVTVTYSSKSALTLKIGNETAQTGSTTGSNAQAGTGASVTATTTSTSTSFKLSAGSEVAYVSSIVITPTTGNLEDCDLALTDAPIALNFDLYNNVTPQVINYTTSSTGAVTIANNSYATFSINKTNKTITVTPTAVTPSAQTITVNQAADATYAAGSATFTLSVSNSAPVITASDVIIESSATSGTITYSISNPVGETTLTATEEEDWINSVAVDSEHSKVTFVSTTNESYAQRTGTIILTYGADLATKSVSIKQKGMTPLGEKSEWNLATNSYASANENNISWASACATMTNSKGNGSNVNNYIPLSQTSTRFYNGNALTIAPISGYKINGVVFTATTEGYASALSGSTWTNATAYLSETMVTVIPTSGTSNISAAIGGTCGFTKVEVYYELLPIPSVAPNSTSVDITTSETYGSIDITYNNLTNYEAEVIFYESDGETETTSNYYSWLDVDINGDMDIDYYIAENTGSSRKAYIKVYALGEGNVEAYSPLITITQAGIDYAILPFLWPGGASVDLLAKPGVTESGLGSDYAAGNAPYLVKFDTSDDYIQIKTNESINFCTIVVKKIGGNGLSSIQASASSNGTDWSNVGQNQPINGDGNAVVTLTFNGTFPSDARYVRFTFTKGSNVGVGPISIYPTSVSGAISPAGWSSFSSMCPLDLSTISGGSAYVASEASGSVVTLAPCTNVVAANTGLMVKGTPNAEFTINVSSATLTTPAATNLLKGQATTSNVAASGTDGKYHYIFGYQTSNHSVCGFYNLAANTEIAAGKAYLETTSALTPAAGAPAIIRILDEENNATSIERLDGKTDAVKFMENGQIYILREGVVYDALGRIVK